MKINHLDFYLMYMEEMTLYLLIQMLIVLRLLLCMLGICSIKNIYNPFPQPDARIAEYGWIIEDYNPAVAAVSTRALMRADFLCSRHHAAAQPQSIRGRRYTVQARRWP